MTSVPSFFPIFLCLNYPVNIWAFLSLFCFFLLWSFYFHIFPIILSKRVWQKLGGWSCKGLKFAFIVGRKFGGMMWGGMLFWWKKIHFSLFDKHILNPWIFHRISLLFCWKDNTLKNDPLSIFTIPLPTNCIPFFWFVPIYCTHAQTTICMF